MEQPVEPKPRFSNQFHSTTSLFKEQVPTTKAKKPVKEELAEEKCTII